MKIRITLYSDYNDYSRTGTIVKQVEKEYSSFHKAQAACTRMMGTYRREELIHGGVAIVCGTVEVVK